MDDTIGARMDARRASGDPVPQPSAKPQPAVDQTTMSAERTARAVRETVRANARRGRRYRVALPSAAADARLSDGAATGKSVLRDHVNATLGFDARANQTGIPAERPHWLLGSTGIPRPGNFAAIMRTPAEHERAAPDLCASKRGPCPRQGNAWARVIANTRPTRLRGRAST